MAPYTPQQNGVAERKNKTLKEMVNSMLSYSGLSEGFWGEDMLTACYILNRTPNKNSKQTPYEIWTKNVPNLTYLRIWGCRAVVRLTEPKMKNLGEKGIDCIFIGYAEHSKCYRFYVIEPNDYVSVNSIIESIDAIFDEERFTPRGMIKLSLGKIVEDEVEGTDDALDKRRELTSFDTYAPVARISTIRFLSSKFDMKDLGEAEVILDLTMKFRHNKGTPVSQLEYSRAIGYIMYAMISTRPDIAFDVGKLSSGYPYVIEGYSDASWINNMEDHSSTSGWVFLLGGGAISWASKKQTCITSSTMESEFVALAAAGNEAEWLRNLVYEIPLWPKPISTNSIRCDSAATLAKAYSQVYN
nr:zinc finger, CCHC-type [Tanacetum cinerariifolium]